MTDNGYKNAATILPPELLAAVQKYHVGRLWIPKTDDYHKERIRLIKELLRRGVPTAEAARLSRLTQRRVQQIQRKMHEAQAKRSE